MKNTIGKINWTDKKPEGFSIAKAGNQLIKTLSGKKYGPDDYFKPIEIFEYGIIKKNTIMMDWNMAEEQYYQPVRVSVFLISMLQKGYNKEMLKNYCDFFGFETVWEVIKSADKAGNLQKNTIKRLTEYLNSFQKLNN